MTRRATPLQNRVDPFGDILATPARGLFFGNRGGRFHRDRQTLGAARWASKAWITCLCEFRGRKKPLFGEGYTGLFFMDEPTALAAGHRPCFECRRDRAQAFMQAIDPFCPPRAGALDRLLDAERRNGREKRRHILPIDSLPDGAIYADGKTAFALRGAYRLLWSFSGYRAAFTRPKAGTVETLTPPTSLAALRAGYQPQWGPDLF